MGHGALYERKSWRLSVWRFIWGRAFCYVCRTRAGSAWTTGSAGTARSRIGQPEARKNLSSESWLALQPAWSGCYPKQTFPRWQQFAVECVYSLRSPRTEATRFSGAVERSEDQARTTARRPDALRRPCKGPEVNSHEPTLSIRSITVFFASLSSPDAKFMVLGLCDEKSCIQAMGILLIDFTSLAPYRQFCDHLARSATLQSGDRSFHPFRTDIGIGIHVGIGRIDQDAPMPVDILQCLGHVHPIRGEDDDIAFSGLRLRTSRCAWAEIGDEAVNVSGPLELDTIIA